MAQLYHRVSSAPRCKSTSSHLPGKFERIREKPLPLVHHELENVDKWTETSSMLPENIPRMRRTARRLPQALKRSKSQLIIKMTPMVLNKTL